MARTEFRKTDNYYAIEMTLYPTEILFNEFMLK